MAAGDKPPRKPAKRTAKKPAKRATATRPKPTAADRAKAAAQIDNVVPIKGGTASRRGRHNAASKGKGPHAPTSPQAIAIHERRETALNLRRLGLTWAQVAQRIHETVPNVPPGYGTSDAYNDAKALIDSVTVTAVHGVREEDLAIALAMQRQLYPDALKGDPKAANSMLKILDYRAKILGMYAPTRHELTGTDGGPIGLAPTATPREIFDAAWAALDGVLSHKQQPALDPTRPPAP